MQIQREYDKNMNFPYLIAHKNIHSFSFIATMLEFLCFQVIVFLLIKENGTEI